MELLSFGHHPSTNLTASVRIFAFPPVTFQEGHLLYPQVSLFRSALDPISSHHFESSGQKTFFLVKVQVVKVLGFVGYEFTHNNSRLLMEHENSHRQ